MVALIHCVSGAPTARNVTSIQHGERFQPRRGLKTTRTLLRRATPSDTPGAGKAWDYGQPDLWKKWDDETFSVGLTRFLNRGATTWVDGKPADAKVLDVQDCGGKKTWIDYMAQPLRMWSYQPGVAARRCQNFFINGGDGIASKQEAANVFSIQVHKRYERRKADGNKVILGSNMGIETRDGGVFLVMLSYEKTPNQLWHFECTKSLVNNREIVNDGWLARDCLIVSENTANGRHCMRKANDNDAIGVNKCPDNPLDNLAFVWNLNWVSQADATYGPDEDIMD